MIKIRKFLKLGSILITISLIASCASSNLKEAEHKHHESMMKHGMSSNKMGSNEMGHSQHKSDTRFYGKRENSVTQVSENKYFKVSLFCDEFPIPIGRIHNWTVHVETPDGKPVENAKVFIFGGMPMHNHEFPTVPRVKEYLGNGDYRVEGVKFSMIGHWEMHFNIEHGNKRDRVEFRIHM